MRAVPEYRSTSSTSNEKPFQPSEDASAAGMSGHDMIGLELLSETSEKNVPEIDELEVAFKGPYVMLEKDGREDPRAPSRRS